MITTIAIFNSQGGAGKTSLIYHLAWMFAHRGVSVVVADLDPQANLTGMFVDEDCLESLWPAGNHPGTIQGVIGEMAEARPQLVEIAENLALLPGDLGLARFEDTLSNAWLMCRAGDGHALRTTSVFHRAIQRSALERNAQLVLIDVGPNLGSINRAALIASDFVVIPAVPDPFGLQGLHNVGLSLNEWRESWKEAVQTGRNSGEFGLPSGDMKPIGYVGMHHVNWVNRVKSHLNWLARIPAAYAEAVLQTAHVPVTIDRDPHCLANLRYYWSLMPMAIEARKPIFFLKPADGALGAHLAAVAESYKDFETLTRKIADACGIAYT